MERRLERRAGLLIWSQIAAELAAEIGAGHHAVGARLPSEGELAVRYGVNRPIPCGTPSNRSPHRA